MSYPVYDGLLALTLKHIWTGILALGNLDLEQSGESCKIRNLEWLTIAASLLGLNEKELQDVLIRKCVTSGGEQIVSYYTPQQAQGKQLVWPC